MSRPLLISDCDEVLLHMVSHFGAWLDEAHDVHFELAENNWGAALTRRADGSVLAPDQVWPLLDGFFATEMHRQTLVPHAAEALRRLGAQADIVILTNLKDQCHGDRVAQLEAVGIAHRVVCNQGGKGKPVHALIEEYAPSVAVFVDDLAIHHESVAEHAPGVWRLQLIAEPTVAALQPKAAYAHARIDDWAPAADWIAARFDAGRPADA
jgi:hypothetical protein